MTKELFSVITDIGIISSFLPVIAFVLKGKTRHSLRRVLLLLALTWLVAECLNWFLAENRLNTFIVYHFYDSISTILYLVLFHQVFPRKYKRSLMLSIGSFYLVLLWGYIIYNNGLFMPITFTSVLSALIPLLLALVNFYFIATETRFEKLTSEPFFWINSAILIHFGVSLVSFISVEAILGYPMVQMYLWTILIVSNIIHNILFSIGVWQMRRT